MRVVDYVALAKRDFQLLAELSGNRPKSFWLARWAISPSLKASTLFRLSANTSGIVHVICRHRLLSKYSCDVSSGVRIEGSLCLPHPVGIVLGTGARIASGVVLYQHVTLGRDGKNQYPTVGDGAKIYAGAVVAGAVKIEPQTSVSANALITSPRIR